MEFCGICGKAKNLIKPYLHDRFQRVLIDYDSRKYSSEWEPVKHGVSQGSICGPLFFLLCINDIPNVVSDISNKFYFQMIRA